MENPVRTVRAVPSSALENGRFSDGPETLDLFRRYRSGGDMYSFPYDEYDYPSDE
jgi:hypothetical protein